MVPTKLQPFPIDTFCDPGSAYFFPTLLEHLMEKKAHLSQVSVSEIIVWLVLIRIAYDSTQLLYCILFTVLRLVTIIAHVNYDDVILRGTFSFQWRDHYVSYQ